MPEYDTQMILIFGTFWVLRFLPNSYKKTQSTKRKKKDRLTQCWK